MCVQDSRFYCNIELADQIMFGDLQMGSMQSCQSPHSVKDTLVALSWLKQ